MRKQLDFNKYHDWFQMTYETYVKNLNKPTTLFISDCDGILTDGRSYFNKNKAMKSYGSYDKEAIRFITDTCGDIIWFVSSDKQGWEITSARLDHVKKSLKNPFKFDFLIADSNLRETLVQNQRNRHELEVVFIGDSLSDIPALSRANWAACTQNAPQDVKEYCNYASNLVGGQGGLADIIFYFYKNYENLDIDK